MDISILVACLLLLPSGRNQAISRNVYAWMGTDVILECKLQSTNSINQVTWQKAENGKDVNFLVVTIDGVNKLTPFAQERVDFLGGNFKTGSIKIRTVTLGDEGVYTCIFTATHSGSTKSPITLGVQVKPDLNLELSPEPVFLKPPYETIATCETGAAKPSATISWLTEGLDFKSSEDVLPHNNGTATTRSQLKMIPRSEIVGHNVTCVVSQPDVSLGEEVNRSLTIQNVHYPPNYVEVMVRILDDGTFLLTCVENSNPPATNFTWRRKEGFDSKSFVELGSGPTYSGKQLPDGVYTCEVTHPLGRLSGSLYYYTVSGACLHAWLWPCLILLILAIGIFLLLRHYELVKRGKNGRVKVLSDIIACCGLRKADEVRTEGHSRRHTRRAHSTSESMEEERGDLSETQH